MGGCPYCLGSGKVVVWKEVDRNEEMVTVQSRLETCSECNGSGFGKIETKELYTESDVKNAFDDGYQAGLEAAQPKWISVEERLPAGACIAVNAENEMLLGRISKLADGSYMCDDLNSGEWIIQVTHWMPLPEPPKEEA